MKTALLKGIVFFVVLVVTLGCSEEKAQLRVEDENDLTGTWLLNEQGYSPGAGYIVEPVPPVPAQIIRFFGDGRMLSNIAGLSDYHFYEVAFDERIQGPFLKIYKTAYDAAAKMNDQSYDMRFSDGDLRLGFRYCYEGCHMKFDKIAEEDSGE